MERGLQVASHLSKKDYLLLLQVYADHNSAMGLEERKNYTLTDIVKVEKNSKEDCLEVYYKNGKWWKYFSDGTWG